VKPPSTARSVAELRVTRKQVHELKHGESMGWAVSYADLLMVLLSFFTLYFSFNDSAENSRADQLSRIAMGMRGEKAGSQSFESKSVDEKVSDIASVFNIPGMKLVERKDSLVVDLDNGVFRSGRFQVEPELKKQIDIVLERLNPYKDKIMITIIGHADSRPMGRKNELLEDNFDLSSARALKVLKYFVAQGFPENHAAARAASSYDRDARAISIEIRPLTRAASEKEGS
jgi:flagellar motor protein MotB